jgi:hypothetical protein
VVGATADSRKATIQAAMLALILFSYNLHKLLC